MCRAWLGTGTDGYRYPSEKLLSKQASLIKYHQAKIVSKIQNEPKNTKVKRNLLSGSSIFRVSAAAI